MLTLTDKELRDTTENLFGRIPSTINIWHIEFIIGYTKSHPLQYHLNKDIYHLVHTLYYKSVIMKDKGCWVPPNVDWSSYHSIGHERAHRLSYALMRGPLIPGKYICHHCDRKGCRNPFHLFQGSPAANIKDSIQKGRMRFHKFSLHKFKL